MTSATVEQPAAPAPADRGAGRGLGAQLARDTLYLLASFPMGVLAFTLLVTGWSTAISLLITFVGVPLALLTIFVTRGIAWVERAASAIVTGEAVPAATASPLPLRRDDWRGVRRSGSGRRRSRSTRRPGATPATSCSSSRSASPASPSSSRAGRPRWR